MHNIVSFAPLHSVTTWRLLLLLLYLPPTLLSPLLFPWLLSCHQKLQKSIQSCATKILISNGIINNHRPLFLTHQQAISTYFLTKQFILSNAPIGSIRTHPEHPPPDVICPSKYKTRVESLPVLSIAATILVFVVWLFPTWFSK
jgi:hypothetical protein